MQDMHWEMRSRTESRYKNEMKDRRRNVLLMEKSMEHSFHLFR